jgi:4-amino-4-deoxychorismate lyase
MTGQIQQLTMVNGEFTDLVSVKDRGLAYGDGVFETMRISWGQIPLLQYHLERLELGCQRLNIPYASDFVRDSLKRFLNAKPAEDHASLKLVMTRGIGGQGYYPPEGGITQPTLILQSSSFSTQDPLAERGIILHRCSFAISGNTYLAGIKHLNRLEYVLAAREVPNTPETQGLLLDDTGHVVESVHHNIFVVRDGTLITPQLERVGVKGVMRRFILDDLAPKLGLSVVEENLTADSLKQAAEIFVCNSLRGIWPVREFEETSWQVPSPVTQRLQDMVQTLWIKASA